MVVATAAVAGTLIQLDAPLVVSTTDPANNAFKAKMGWISYMSDPAQTQYDVKAQVLVYADGPAGAQNIYIARSVDNGANWTEQAITSSGGAPLTIGSSNFTVTNNKPNIYVAPVGVIGSTVAGAGANALVTFTSSDCEGSAAQKINNNLLTGPQPYMCLWAARSRDGGVTWTLQRLTDGSLDADEDVPAGYVTYRADATKPYGFSEAGGFAISFQADPAGLQQGDAEGPGDGASGAKVSAGTNIWYTFLNKASFENGVAFPAPVQVSDNNDTTVGAPGASRANLAISGGTVVLAYEETKGTTDGAKQIVYHSFNYAAPQTNNAGTVVSSTQNNARRVRFVLQGNEAIGDADLDGDAADGDTAGVHVLMIWRESTSTVPASPADIVMRRGIKDTTRAGSTGFLATDILADTPVNLSDTGPGDNALAHRALLRGEFAAVAFDRTADKAAADAFTATYDLYVMRSTDGGATWGAARNMSNLPDASLRVVEPRMVGTPGTIKLPNGAATGDASDIQDKDVFYVGWGTETNEAVAVPGDIYLTRTTDKGLNYERIQLLAEGPTEQSEAQLRTPPDGATLGALWMQRDATTGTVDVVYRNGSQITVADPDLSLTASNLSVARGAQGQVSFVIENKGAGDARSVVLTGTAPSGLTISGSTDVAACSVAGPVFTCKLAELPAGQSRTFGVLVTSGTVGTYQLPAEVSGDVIDANAGDNAATATVTVTDDDGGGCTMTAGKAPFDPSLLLLAALGLGGIALRRVRRQG